MDMKNIQIIFFLPSPYESQDDSSEEMQQAFEACKQNSIEVKWVLEYEFKSLELKKTDIIVFPSFEGACFEKVQSSKSVRIVGPWCLLTCLTQGVKIPNFPWPIYSIAMNNCTITGSALPKAQRLEIQEKIQHMGGFYILNLVKKCTHLVTDSVKSEKYIKAAETGVKILLPSWVYDVWESSSKGNIHCNDAPFIDKHRCPTFHKLVVCCTGLSMPQRTELHRLIEENGGTYKEQLHLSSTDILVCNSGTASNKYLAAKKRNIKCVSFDWVKDSIKNGYAMPDNHYSVKISTSTPTKDDMAPPNFSMISNITTLSKCTNPNDTIEGTFNISMPPPQSVIKKRKMDSNEHNELVDSINMQNVKMAGPFLDGCGIYLVGFGMEQREKLCKILNFGGATRYDDISERVTHIIVGNTSCHDLKLLTFKDTFKNYPIVSIQWLLDSLIAECPVSEEKYIISAINLTKPDSPLSKKGLHVLRENNSSQERSIHISTAVSEIEVDVAKQYLGNAASVEEDTLARLLHDASDFQSKKDTPCIEIIEPPKSLERKQSLSNKDDSFSSAVDDSSQPSEPIFEDLKFVITGFPADSHEQVKLTIEAMSGKIASKLYKGVLDYAVVPIISTELLKQPATYIVTDLWISECWQENEIRPVSYFHKPISIKEGAHPLKGCVITLSSYVNYERIFLRNLIMELGGICQDQLSKITCSKTGVIACTHLVTPEPTGKKYVAAVKWGMPVINKDWLLECARTSQLASESLYLVGDSKCKYFSFCYIPYQVHN